MSFSKQPQFRFHMQEKHASGFSHFLTGVMKGILLILYHGMNLAVLTIGRKSKHREGFLGHRQNFTRDRLWIQGVTEHLRR